MQYYYNMLVWFVISYYHIVISTPHPKSIVLNACCKKYRFKMKC